MPLGFTPLADAGVLGLPADGDLADAAFIAFAGDTRRRLRFLAEVDAVELGATTVPPDLDPVAATPIADFSTGDVIIGQRTFFFGDGKWIGSPSDSRKRNTYAEARMISSANIERTIPISPESTRRTAVTTGEIQLANPDGALDFIASGYSVSGRGVRVYVGPSDGAFEDFRLIADVLGDRLESDLNIARLQVQPTSALLDIPLQPSRYSGAGGAGGDSDLAGRPLPVCFGSCFNVSPILINRDEWIFQVHDGPIEAIPVVRERGLPFDAAGDVATYAALRGVVVAGGTYVTCKARGMVKLGLGLAGPAGPITADVRGDKSLGLYAASTGEILLRIATMRGRLDPRLLKIASFQNLDTALVGYYADGSAELRCDDVFNDLMRAHNGWYGQQRDRLLRAAIATPPEENLPVSKWGFREIMEIEEVSLEQAARYEQTVTYAKNWTPMQESDISEALPTEDRQRLMLGGQTYRARHAESRIRDRAAVAGETLETYFADQEPARLVCTRIMSLHSVQRRRFRMTLPRRGFVVDLGSTIHVTYPRYGLDGGRSLLVQSTRDDGRKGFVDVVAWGSTSGPQNLNS